MTTVVTEATTNKSSTVDGQNGRTLLALFHHPIAHNLKWNDVVKLFKKLGGVELKENDEFVFQVGAECLVMRGPHSKDLTASEVADLRHILSRAGWSPDKSPERPVREVLASPNLLAVISHHEANIYEIDGASPDVSKHLIKPYDPHNFLHHLTHRDQPRERGQRASEDFGFYERIAQSLTTGGKIVVVGHGKGHSNAAKHLIEFLRSHHLAIFHRVVYELENNPSSDTVPQLLAKARDVLG